MSFQFRRRADVREQSPQQEPFFQTSQQQPFVETNPYPQMGHPQAFDPRFHGDFSAQQQQNQAQPPLPTQQPYFSSSPGNFYGQQQPVMQAGVQGQMQQGMQPQYNSPHMLNPSMGQPYGVPPQQMQQQQYQGMSDPSYVHPVQASQLAGQKSNFAGYTQQQSQPTGYAPEDVRSLSFWQENQSNSGFEDPEIDESSNSPIKLIVAVAGVALVAGLSWFAYKWAKSPSSDTPPLIHAEPGPHKVSPDHRGGINIPYQDKLIYDRIGDGVTEEPAERLLPPPEAPMMNAPVQQSVAQNSPQQPMYSEIPEHQQNVMPGTQAPQAQEQAQYANSVNYSSQQQKLTDHQQSAPIMAPPVAPIKQTDVAPAVKVQPQDEEIEPEVINKVKATPTIKGNYFVQMATVKSEAAALREWKRLQAKHNLKGMKSQIKESETTDGEVVYRLLMGPFEEKVKALKYAVKIDGTKVVHVTE